ncbi:MAG: amino acid ABC transporter permease [Hyphomicrobiaceae bacterium TMED74]|nr:amino acid ABC transporter permease [Filomicrobium sp.]RPG48507.1 MAG: amino acid ABC transporter permease [Hyphomicrobiaceae bacterium TMED74]
MELRFFEIYRNSDYMWLLAEGTLASAAIMSTAGALAFILALGLATLRHERVPVLGWLAAAYVDFIRNTPLIVQLFFVAFGLPRLLDYAWPFWAHALFALTLNFSAYFSEIIRAGFRESEGGQAEAAASLGMSRYAVLVNIIIPQSIGRMYPSLNAQFIFLFLTTGIISEVSVRDLTYAGVFIDSRSFRTFEVFLTLTVIYIILSLSFKFLLTRLERRIFHWKFAR